MCMDGLPVVTKADACEIANPPGTVHRSNPPNRVVGFPRSRRRFPPIALRSFHGVASRASSTYPTAVCAMVSG